MNNKRLHVSQDELQILYWALTDELNRAEKFTDHHDPDTANGARIHVQKVKELKMKVAQKREF